MLPVSLSLSVLLALAKAQDVPEVPAQVSWISYSTIFSSWATTTNGLAETNDSRLSFRGKLPALEAASSPGRFQDQRETQVDNMHQADMWLSSSRTTTSSRRSVRRLTRKALRNESDLWPNAEVPFIISMDMPNNYEVQLNQAFEAFHHYTCIRFRPRRKGDHDFVRFVDGFGCSSYVGRIGGPQEFYFTRTCVNPTSTVLHEIGHLIGFLNEISRPDRDDYVTVRLENIESHSLSAFEKRTFDTIDSKGIPYDYLSIMHYGPYTFSRNRQIVIETKNISYQSLIGRSTCLSFRDVKLANIMYRCSERSGCGNIICPGEGFVGQDCRCWCPSQNRSITAEPCSDMITRRQDGELTVTNKTANPSSTSWITLNLALSVTRVVAIVIGCALACLAILMVLIFAALRKKYRTPKNVQTRAMSREYCSLEPRSTVYNYDAVNPQETMCINTEEMNMLQTSGLSKEYCSPYDVPADHTYAAICPQEPLCTPINLETGSHIYCELTVPENM